MGDLRPPKTSQSRPPASSDSLTNQEIELLNETFPNFLCICELCNCGRHVHHKDCKKRGKPSKPVDMDCTLSDYQRTYVPYPGNQRRLPIFPTIPQRNPHPAPMDLNTIQRTDFIQRGQVVKPERVTQKHTYKPTDAPLDGNTVYKETYPGHVSFPNIQMRRPRTQQGRGIFSAKFDSRTTNKEQFKHWNSHPEPAFSEYPCFTGSIIYPGTKMEHMESTTQHDFPGAVAEPVKMVKITDGNLSLEGKHDHLTVHKATYTNNGLGHRAERIKHEPTIKSRGKFHGKTQHMRDFPTYKSQPLPVKPITPPPATIRLSMDSRLEFKTEQQMEFGGYDVKQNPKRGLIRHDIDEYKPPEVSFETDTVNKLTYRPIEVRDAPTHRRPHTNHKPRSAKFNDQTINKKFYKDWKVKPRIRYGDFHEAHSYVKPQGSMEIESWTGATYTTKKPDPDPVRNFKPEQTAIEHTGKFDFTTVHQATYKGTRPKMCKAQAYLLQQELKRRKPQKVKQREQTLGNFVDKKKEMLAAT
ncbi:stabilizer of axonemal microtubules 1-like [Anneissia japonica]|uniref:stabilizer of axonemal microtubules 1-like n=1 Tax=Anneissia japonica TaxID=1529436 RepID=UPI0014255335|nr:stabilizer of axonemal microtubules 1-like [Anneissia japonica]